MLLRRLQHSGGSSSNKAKAPAPAPSASSCSPSTSNPTLIGFTRQPTTTATSSATRTWLLPLLCLAIVAHVSGEIDRTIQEHENKNVVLPCPVNEEKCGKLHSLNWFKGDGRIAAMLLGDSNVTSVNDEFKNRVTVEQNPYRLVIKDLRISDEDIYLCDTTFYIPEETCDNFNGYRVELRVLVPPTEVVILDAKGDRIENGSIVGPMQERQNLKATCTVKNTRPQPDVGWWRGNKRLATYSPTHDQNDGLYTSTLELDWQLSREDLGEDIECRVESAAIKNTIVTKFGVDLQVRPTSIDIKGVEHHTVQGSKVVLTCDIHGARPAVNLTWYNSTSTISPEENELTEIRTKAFEKSDGTYHTQSELIFNASRFENDRVFRCEAENIVLQINREKPISSDLTLEVMYPPVVKVSPLERVANTSEMVLLNCEYVANPASLTQVVWYRNGDVVNVNDTNRYEGGNAENVALLIRATEKEDIGNYTCQLSNSIGKTISEQQIDLDVQYVPIVEVLMLPEGPVKESDESNVTLTCNIIDANPSVLTKVRWYANSTLLKELPDCYETREDLCHIDPSKLLLESIGRGFFYNYSCEGYNAAGWGPRSEDKELMVHYEPGPATLSHFPPIAIKKKSVIFYCSVEDPGYPESNRYRWMRGGRGPLQDIVTKEWTVEPVGLDSRTNYSCYAYNEGGKGVMATVNLEVHAPPFFIKNMQPYTGVLHSVSNFNLTCRIECVPRCEIAWWKDGVPIDKNDSRYFVREKYMDASPATGDFESMFSVLHFNMSNFPNKKFDIESDNAKYMCISTANAVGPTVNSTTYLSIEYAPDDISVSESTVYVQEHHIPGRVICKSQANPEPSYEWLYPNKTVTMGNTLIINDPIKRNDTGIYTCRAFNKHGDRTTETRIDVQFTPRCEIERLEIDDQDTLICTADGNPDEADFSWSVKLENDTEALGGGDKKSFKNRSYYVLTGESDIARTYRCLANNTVGPGAVCEIEVAAGSALYLWWQEQLVWWQRWDKTMLYIVISAIALLLLAVIIICIIIICICRRRRRQDKYHTEVSISANQSVLSYQPVQPQVGVALPIQETTETTLLPSTLLPPQQLQQQQQQQQQQQLKLPAMENNNELATPPPTARNSALHATVPKSPPRWPLRPGVMLHVSSDTKENLAVNRMTLKPNANANSNPNSNPNASQLSAQLSAVLNDSQTNSNSTMLTEVTVMDATATGATTTTSTATAIAAAAAAAAKRRLMKTNPNDIALPSTDAATSSAEVLPELAACLDNPIAATASTTTTTVATVAVPGSMQRIWNFVFRRAKRTEQDDGIRDSQRSHVGLLHTFWRGRGSSGESPFGAQHRLKGIRSSGSVTYKKTPTATNSTTTTTTATAEATATTTATCSPSSVPSHASVTFQAPSLDKTPPADTTTEAAAAGATGAAATAVHAGPGLEPAQLQPVRGILKCPTPPPRPPPPILPLRRGPGHQQQQQLSSDSGSNTKPKPSIPSGNTLPPLLKRTVMVSPSRVERVQIHDKSSSLGDPLTEPGEYENLPFHGLQTAPNKFSTTPTNFNNNTNVVRVAPRPKRLNGNIGQAMNNPQQMHHQTLQHPQQQQHFYDQQQQQQLQQQQQQHQQQLQYNTLQYGRGCTAPPSHNRSMDQLESGSDQIQYNLSNCFPKSYTEYYQQHHHQQQQQQQQQSQQQQPQTSQQQSQKFHTNSASNAQLLNAIEHDYQPTYAVVERLPPPPPAPSSALLNTNPFLAASNFKKYDAAGQEELLGSMQRGKRGKAASLLDRMDMDKKFYSLKFPNGGGGNNKLKKPAYNLNASLATATANATSTAPKCKRHHSFAGGSHGDIESNGKPMRLYDPPVYENVADKCNGDTLDNEMGDDGSSNILNAGSNLNLSLNQNLATVQLHTQPTAAVVSQSHKKKHHHRQHQQKADAQAGAVGADFQLMEPERLSIYRSDSGISNSSYESQLPALGQRTPKSHKASSSGLNLTRKPVYMNVEGQQQQQQQQIAARAGSPAHNINSSYESASSAPVTDPTSLSSCNSLYSSGTGTVSVSNTRCNRHPASHHQQQQQQHQHQKQPTPEITTPEDYEQYQLGHQPGHSASMLSVASSISAASRGKSKPSASTTAATSALQLQQQQQLSQRVGPHEHLNGITTATATAAATTTTVLPAARNYDDRPSVTPTHISNGTMPSMPKPLMPTATTTTATSMKPLVPTVIAARQQQQRQHLQLQQQRNKLAATTMGGGLSMGNGGVAIINNKC
ncbi:uncharacterized protein LOC132794519 isoform X3 [Drosophila nasuta]|uniref:uncharacterized protein LOC132794519 isoform X3 n=1 Tax=Drosophila nasuta TaxID=42062 RepID=UPI00295E5307|nr:uncharacterized protein LOC132794519 isoform X3 [Drosophila nasuta]